MAVPWIASVTAVIGSCEWVPYGSLPMLYLDDSDKSPKQSTPAVHLDVETRVRQWTVTRLLEPSAEGMQEAVAEDAQGVQVLLRVPGDNQGIERVFAEAALAKRHRHWGIVQTLGVVDHEGWPVQVVEHVDGLTLDHVSMLAGSLAPEAVCRIGAQLAMILVELHREPGGFHGAISGERVLVDAAGHVRLADLGRARPEQLFRLLSPERRASGGVGSPEDDLYAMGGTLIEAALGRPLERTIGWIDTRALGGVLPERLIDALEALVAPSGKRLKNAAAVMRVFESIEPLLGDGAGRLKKAVEYARIGAAIGATAAARHSIDDERVSAAPRAVPGMLFEPFDDGADEHALTDPGAGTPAVSFTPFASAPSGGGVVAAADDAPTEDSLPAPATVISLAAQVPLAMPPYVLTPAAQAAPVAADDAPEEPTLPGTAPIAVHEAAFFAQHAAKISAASEEAVTAAEERAPAGELEPAEEPARAEGAPVTKKKWPLFSRMLAWGFVSLLAINALAVVWVLAEPPLSRAFGTELPKLPGSELSLEQMAQGALLSLVANAEGAEGDPLAGLDLGALAAAAPVAVPATAADEEPAAEAAAAVPALDFGADAPALSDKEQAEFAAALQALAAELEKAQPGLEATAPAAVEEPAALAAAPDATRAGGRPIGMPKRKALKAPAASPVVEDKPLKAAKAEKPAKAEHPVKADKPAKADTPAKVAKAERSAEATAVGAPVKLVVEAPSSMRAAAEAGLRSCNLKSPVLGVVRVSPAGTVRSVSTDPLNPCVAKVLKQTLGGFEEDAPFEVRP